jgi:hypothetical protein
MNEIREAFLAASEVALQLLRHPSVPERWDKPSVLAHMEVAALCGHLKRATGSVETYLDRDEPTEEPFSAAEYYAAALEDDSQTGTAPNLDSELHRAIRERSVQEAAGGYAEILTRSEEVLERLRARLDTEPEDRRVTVFRDISLLLDDYLITRMIEIAVHTDDLAQSLDLPTPEMPSLAMDLGIEALVDVARVRHGDLAVLRALTRRERDASEALRVL